MIGANGKKGFSGTIFFNCLVKLQIDNISWKIEHCELYFKTLNLLLGLVKSVRSLTILI